MRALQVLLRDPVVRTGGGHDVRQVRRRLLLGDGGLGYGCYLLVP